MIRSTSLCLTLILVAACSNAPAPVAAPEPPLPMSEEAPSTVIGSWHWLGTVGSAPVSALEPARYAVEFQDSGSALIQADCNRGRSDYGVDPAGAALFGPIGLTKMGCAADSQDRQFLAQLRAARTAISAKHWLRMSLADGESHAVFARDPQARLRHYRCTAGQRYALAMAPAGALLWIDGEFHALALSKGEPVGNYRGGRFEVRVGEAATTLLIDGKALTGCQQLD